MSKRILIDASVKEETRVALIDNKKVIDYDYELLHKPQIKGNIYLAKITRVEPSLQAAFIEYGGDKHGFLPFSEIHPSYYHIPVTDRDKQEKHVAEKFKLISPPDLSVIIEEEINDVGENNKKPNKTTSADDDSLEVQANINDNLVDEEIMHFDHEADSFRNSYKKYKIQEVIKKNQVILVQVIKEERGNKGASFTSFISLAGRYCVLMPNIDKQGGISRKVIDASKRKRLKNIVDGLMVPEGVSVIIRTAGEDRSSAEIRRDYDYLVRLWNNIREHTIASKAPTFIHAEGDLIKRTVRDVFDYNTKEILVQGEEAYNIIVEFTKKIFPGNESKIKHYNHPIPIFKKLGIDEQIMSLYSMNSQLESGGYLVISSTEALTSIDVNSGKSTSERNIEETAVKTNVEAAKEVARQIKLRDISGLIVIDFIDMIEYHNRRIVEKVLRDSMKHDKARVQMSSISPFGLVEISRQRLRSSFAETNMITCPYCAGKGKIRDPETNAILILRTIESEIVTKQFEAVTLYTHQNVILYLLNNKRKYICALEDKYNVKIQFEAEEHSSLDGYSIDRIQKTSSKNNPRNQKPTVSEEEIEIDDINTYSDSDFDDIENTDEIVDLDNNDEQKMFKINKMSNNRRRTQPKKSQKNNLHRRRKKHFEDSSIKNNQNSKEESWWKRLFG